MSGAVSVITLTHADATLFGLAEEYRGWEKICIFHVSSMLTPLGWSRRKLLIKRPVTVQCKLICDIRRYMSFSAQLITKWFPCVSIYRNCSVAWVTWLAVPDTATWGPGGHRARGPGFQSTCGGGCGWTWLLFLSHVRALPAQTPVCRGARAEALTCVTVHISPRPWK